MVKNKYVYLCISDLHYVYNNKDNRYNYRKEILDVFGKIKEIIKRYIDRDFKVVLIFLGDLIDRTFKDMMEAIAFNNMMLELSLLCDEAYSVIGNHELTYYKDNPFWSLVKDLQSNNITTIKNKSWQPRGVFNILTVTDRLVHGDTEFLFNHFGCGIIEPSADMKTVGLFHQDICCKPIVESARKKFKDDYVSNHTIYLENRNVLKGYDVAVFGHMHKVYGSYTFIDDSSGFKTLLYFMGSLGRPNHTEVNDSFLERNIIGIKIEDDKFNGVENNKFILPSRTETVKEEIVAKQQFNRSKLKETKELLNYKAVDDRPVENIRTKLELSGKKEFVNLFDEYLTTNTSEVEKEAYKNYRKIFR